MLVSFRANVLIAALSISGVLYGQTSSSLLVLSKSDHTLAVVDSSSLRVIAKVPVGNDPHEVIASTDGTRAYVSNYGFGAYNTLTVVDLVADKVLRTVDLGALRGPHGLSFAQGKPWFTAEVAKAIACYDPTSHKVDWILGTGQNRTHMIWVSQDAQHIVTTNVNSGTVSIMDEESPRMVGPSSGFRRAYWDETVVRVGNGSEGFDVSPDGNEIWVANAKDGTLSIIDFHKKKVIQTLAANVPGANRLKFTPNGEQVLVSSGPELVVFDARTRKQIKRIPVGHGSGGVLVQPDGERAFIACGPDNYVAVIDLHSLAVTGHIEAGRGPDGMAWAVLR